MVDKIYIKEEEKISIEDLENSLNDLENSNNIIKQIEKDTNAQLENFKLNYKMYKLYKKKNIISSIAAIIILLLVPIKLIKAPCRYYNAKEYKYSTNEGLTKENKEIPLRDYDGNKIYIKDYKIVDGQQEIKTYDVSNVILGDIKNYLNYNVNNLDYDIEYKLLSDEELKEEEIRQIIKLNVNTDVNYYPIEVLLNFILLLIIIDNFTTNLKNTMLTQSSKRNALDIYIDLNRPLSELKEEILNNDILRNKFVKLFNENKYLLNNPTLLEEKYSELIESLDTLSIKEEIKEIGQKVRELKKSRKLLKIKH